MSDTITYFSLQLKRDTAVRDLLGDAQYTTQDALYELFAHMSDYDREHLTLAMFDTRQKLIGLHEAAIGTIDAAITTARELMKVLVLANAHTWTIAHNHPSGACEPSQADNKATRTYAAASYLMGIPLIDHLVIGHDCYYSYAQSNPSMLRPKVKVESQAIVMPGDYPDIPVRKR